MNLALSCLICSPAVLPCFRQRVVKICVWKACLFSLSFVTGDTLVLDTRFRPCGMIERCAGHKTFATLLMARLEYHGKYFLVWCTGIRRYIITYYV